MNLKTFAMLGMVLLLIVGFSGCVSGDSKGSGNDSGQSADKLEDTFGGATGDSGNGDAPPSPPS